KDVAVEVKERSDVLARPRDFLDFNTLTLTRTLPARYISAANHMHHVEPTHALFGTTIGDGFLACEIFFAAWVIIIIIITQATAVIATLHLRNCVYS
ncbi:hypothetical protein BDFB_012589, partial [Asbolus verrucosus]